jgi:hypothetical protein
LGIEGERALVLTEFRDLDQSVPMSAEQLKRVIAHFEGLLGPGKAPAPRKGVQAWLDAQIKDMGRISAARHRLVESGMAEAPLLRFPAEQVLLLDEKREFEVRRDEIMKAMALPAWQAEAILTHPSPYREPALFEPALLEGVYGTCLAKARLDQRIALLRHVEALRLYAAEHDNKLPVKLSDISVPLPDDPFTGKAFQYEVNGNTAHLRGSPPPSMATDPAYKVHYEVAVRTIPRQ